MHHTRGLVARQAHVDLPEGTVEEEFGREGFFGGASHLYRTDAPVGWTRIEGDIKPVALRATALEGAAGSPDGRAPFLVNQDVRLSFARIETAADHWFRNADSDEVLFVHEGHGRIESDFGELNYRAGDYVVIPRGTVRRILPAQQTALLMIESREAVRLPDRGLLGKHALFDPALLEVPSLDPEAVRARVEESKARHAEHGTEYAVRVQRGGRLSTIYYPFHPLNTVGWKGDLSVYRINVEDIRPVMSERYHLPPSAHATFVTDSWVLCSFLPRGLETGDPKALRVPFYHANIDYDEVIFYHDGDFFSREGIEPGMVTFHPQGIHHGPQPGAVKAVEGKTRTEEIAVMVDTRNPLDVVDAARNAELPNYWRSWQG